MTSAGASWVWIFDLDGTITDHPSNFARMIASAFDRYNIPYESNIPSRLVRTIQQQAAGKESTLGYLKAINYALKHVGGVTSFWKRAKFIYQFSKIFHAELYLAEMYTGVPEVFHVIKNQGDQIAIVTNGSRKETHNTLSRHWDHLDTLVDLVVTRDELNAVKPNPEGILLVLGKLVIPPERAVMVGDSWHDIRAAKAAGTKSVALLCGYGLRENLEPEKPTFLVDSVMEIAGIIDQLKTS